jgi:hypothetical protein
MIQVGVEAHAGGGRGGVVDGHLQFVLQLLLPLTLAHDAGGAAEERIVGGFEFGGQAQGGEEITASFRPLFAEGPGLLGRADAHELVHLERLHPRQVGGGFAAKAVRLHLHRIALVGHYAARRHGGIDRVAARRRQYEIAGRLGAGPVAAGVVGLHQVAVRALVPAEAMHGAEQVGEVAEVADAFEIGARRHRWEPHSFRLAPEQAIDRPRQAFYCKTEVFAVPVDALSTRRDQGARTHKLLCKPLRRSRFPHRPAPDWIVRRMR